MTTDWHNTLQSAASHLAAAHARPSLEADLAALPPITDLPNVLFINAHPRSGTNWLGSLMNLHRRIACTGEFTFHDLFNGMQALVNAPGRAARREPMRSAALQAFQRFVHQTMASQAALKPGVRWVGDHTPRRLRFLVPGASHIALFRDGRDVLVSWTFNALARREDWVVPQTVRPLFEAQLASFARGGDAQQHAGAEMLADEQWVRHVARQWAAQVRDDLDAFGRISRGDLPGRITAVRYEDLHADLEGERRRLYAFLDLDPAEAEPVSDQTRTSTTFIREEDPASHYRRGRVGDWRKRLSTAAVQWFEIEAAHELSTLGYEVEGSAATRVAREPVHVRL